MSSRFDSARFADYPLTVLAFHGTSEDVAEKVLSGREELKVSQNPWEWLGNGVYFWENAPERALRWAIERKKKNPTVVGAVIQIGHCLNLMDKSSNDPLTTAYEIASRTFEQYGIPLPQNSGKFHNLDAVVINMLHTCMKESGSQEYDTVRAAYIEGDPVYPGSEINTDTHIQICVRNPKKSIVAYFRPRMIES